MDVAYDECSFDSTVIVGHHGTYRLQALSMMSDEASDVKNLTRHFLYAIDDLPAPRYSVRH